MKILKKGIKDDKFLGSCYSCRCVVEGVRGEFKNYSKESVYPLFANDDIPDSIIIMCPECDSRMSVYMEGTKNYKEIQSKL